MVAETFIAFTKFLNSEHLRGVRLPKNNEP